MGGERLGGAWGGRFGSVLGGGAPVTRKGGWLGSGGAAPTGRPVGGAGGWLDTFVDGVGLMKGKGTWLGLVLGGRALTGAAACWSGTGGGGGGPARAWSC